MKKIAKLFSITIVLPLLLCTAKAGTSAVAQPEDSKEKKMRNEYIAEVLSEYLQIEGRHDGDKIMISNPIHVINNSDSQSQMYFIMEDDSYIAQLVVTKVNGAYYSSFMFDSDSRIDSILKDNTAFALIALGDDCLILQTAEKNIVIAGNDSTATDRRIPACELSAASFTEVQQAQNEIRQGRDYYISLPVPYVGNVNGLCWAACIAAVSNYRMGTSYKAMDIYDALDGLYIGTPEGTNTWYIRGYAYCGMTCTCTSGMSFTRLYTQLSSNHKPAIFGVFRTGGAHAVVCKHFEGGNEYASYGFMDPNKSNTVYIHFSDPHLDPANFVYANGLQTYTEWRYTRY